MNDSAQQLMAWLFGPKSWCPKCRAGIPLPHAHERDDGKELVL